nr:hypothetical protein [Tanacetum cinerariifolium]
MDEAIKKCLEKKQGDYSKCKRRFQALNSSPKKSPTKPPHFPFRLRAGSLTDPLSRRKKVVVTVELPESIAAYTEMLVWL